MAAYSARAVVIANGELGDIAWRHANVRDDDFIVCVDGGLRHAISRNIQPRLLVGDFDSATATDLTSTAIADVERLEHPVSKDASDLELTLQELVRRELREVVLIGISGGRVDHTLFNWLLPAAHDWPFGLRLIDESADAHTVTQARSFSMGVRKGTTVSLLPLTDVTGITTRGFKYPLNDASINIGSTLGLSNIASADEVSVALSSGVALVIKSLSIDYEEAGQTND